MPIKTKRSSVTHPGQHKRRGSHHKHGRQYRQVYWPYIPLVILMVGAFLFSSLQPLGRRGILSYATSMSSNALLDATNAQRQQNKVGSLRLNAQLAAAAQSKAKDMANRDYWSHNTPEGQEPWVFIQRSGYSYQKAGENLAYGFSSSDAAVAGWMTSPGHKANLLDSAYTDVGFGFTNASNYQNSGKETIVVAMYGRPATVAAAEKSPEEATKISPVTSARPVVEPATATLSYVQTLTGGRLPWASFAIGIFIGSALVFLALKHGLAFRRLLREGEAFVLHHRMLDLVLISLVILATFLTKTSGFIR